jgi:hypothetical protein
VAPAPKSVLLFSGLIRGQFKFHRVGSRCLTWGTAEISSALTVARFWLEQFLVFFQIYFAQIQHKIATQRTALQCIKSWRVSNPRSYVLFAEMGTTRYMHTHIHMYTTPPYLHRTGYLFCFCFCADFIRRTVVGVEARRKN